jgi:hypothetical protein
LVKVVLVGLGSRACHVLHYSVNSNAILGSGGNSRVIRCNWGVNRDFLKFRGWIEKVVIVKSGKV